MQELKKYLEQKKSLYNANLATGFQFIEDNSKQWTYRVQAKFGYKFSDRLTQRLWNPK
jgi:hypothetical protein